MVNKIVVPDKKIHCVPNIIFPKSKKGQLAVLPHRRASFRATGGGGGTVSGHSTLPTNLIHYWDFDANDDDIIGSITGTEHNTPTNEAALHGNGYTFDSASSEYITLSSSPIPSNNDFSVSMWVKSASATNPSGDESLLNTTQSGSDIFNLYFDTNGYIEFFSRRSGGGATFTLSAAQDDYDAGWHLIVLTWDHSEAIAELWVDGTSVDSTDQGTYTISPTTTFAFAAKYTGSPSQYFDGQIDEVGVWDKILSSDEISDLYNSGSGIPYD